MSEEQMLKYLIAFILGWIICKHMGNGFSVGGQDDVDQETGSGLGEWIRNMSSWEFHECPNETYDSIIISIRSLTPTIDDLFKFVKNCPNHGLIIMTPSRDRIEILQN